MAALESTRPINCKGFKEDYLIIRIFPSLLHPLNSPNKHHKGWKILEELCFIAFDTESFKL